MESALMALSPPTKLTFRSLSKLLNRHFISRTSHLVARHRHTPIPIPSLCYNSAFFAPSENRFSAVRRRLECISSSAASFGTSPGGGGGGGGSGSGGEFGGGGGGGSNGLDGGDAKAKFVTGGAEEVSSLSPDVIILDVGGMTCGGCAASVKRILEGQPQVSSASVNLTTETAVVWPKSEAKVIPNWQKELGEALAKHLTNCGFTSNHRDSRRENFFKTFERKMDEKRDRLKESGRELAVSWVLCAVCLLGHLSHTFAAKASWIHCFIPRDSIYHCLCLHCSVLGDNSFLMALKVFSRELQI